MKFIFCLCCWSQCSLAFQFKMSSVSSEEFMSLKRFYPSREMCSPFAKTAINFLNNDIVSTKHIKTDYTGIKFSRLLLYFPSNQYIKQKLSTRINQKSTSVAWLECSKEIKAIRCTLLEVEWESASNRVDKLKQCLSRVLWG